MILFTRIGKCHAQDFFHLVALFGVGLIGRSIASSLMSLGRFQWTYHPFTWAAPRTRMDQRDWLISHISGLPGFTTRPADRIDVVWAAGKTGFESSLSETTLELEAFRDVVNFAADLRQLQPNADVVFHLISSAGGLFEGQLLVDNSSSPRPRRPYGHLKLRQEKFLSRRAKGMSTMVYRPSSVYGFGNRGSRAGLISTLLRNSIEHKVTKLFGHSHTIRDYVFVIDVGRFVANQLVGLCRGDRTILLASGKPTATSEIIERVQQTIGKAPYVQFDNGPTNAASNSFSPNALPPGWSATDLAYGIRDTALRLQQALWKSPSVGDATLAFS